MMGVQRGQAERESHYTLLLTNHTTCLHYAWMNHDTPPVIHEGAPAIHPPPFQLTKNSIVFLTLPTGSLSVRVRLTVHSGGHVHVCWVELVIAESIDGLVAAAPFAITLQIISKQQP